VSEEAISNNEIFSPCFSSCLVGSLNMSVGVLQMLVWKGLLTRDEATFILDVAARGTAKEDIPAPFDGWLATAYAEAQESLRQA
jgi:hypothetical protein